MEDLSGTRQPKHSFIPKSYPRFEFTIPSFQAMSLSAPEVDGAPPEGLRSQAPQDAASRWLAMRREALVEVRRDTHDSKPFMVARSRLMKSENNTKVCSPPIAYGLIGILSYPLPQTDYDVCQPVDHKTESLTYFQTSSMQWIISCSYTTGQKP